MNFSNLALTNRVYSGQASSWITDYPTSAKPRTLQARNFGYLTFVRIFEKNTRIMTTKLTLTVQKDVIERAKSYAKVSGRSLSELIEQYLETITQENNTQPISPRLKKLIGAVKLPKDFDEKKELQNYLEKKHL